LTSKEDDVSEVATGATLGWREMPSVSPGGKGSFFVADTPHGRRWVVWDRLEQKWIVHGGQSAPKGESPIYGRFSTSNAGKRFVESQQGSGFKESVEQRPKRRQSRPSLGNDIILYGGVPVRYSTAVRDLDEKARATGEKDWMKIRDAGLIGLSQFSERHGPLPDDVQPLTYDEFQIVSGLKSGEQVPREVFEKWITMYSTEDRARFGAQNALTTPAPPESADLQSVHASRSSLSQSSDERQEHSRILDPDDPGVEAWKRDPGRADIRGIDTPPRTVRGPYRRRKGAAGRKPDSVLGGIR